MGRRSTFGRSSGALVGEFTSAEIGAVARGGGVYSLQATGPLQTSFGDTGFGFCEEIGVAPASTSVGFLFRWEGGVEVFPKGCAEALASSAL